VAGINGIARNPACQSAPHKRSCSVERTAAPSACCGFAIFAHACSQASSYKALGDESKEHQFATTIFTPSR